jgi:hypothetical protein
VLRAHLHPDDVLFPVCDAAFRTTQFPLTPIEHFRAPIQAIFALTDALLEFLQIFPTLLSFLLELRFGAKPMLFSLQQRLFALALSILHGLVSEALRFFLNRSSLALNACFPQQISAQEAPASQS